MEYVVIIAIWFLAGFINGLSGMGAGLFAVPIMALFMDMHFIVPITCFIGTIVSGLLAIKFRQEIHIKDILPCLALSIPGAFLGSYILHIIPTFYIKIFMTIFLLTYVSWIIFHKSSQKENADSIIYNGISGFASGLFGATISFTGPPIAVYVLYTGMNKQKALGLLGTALIFTTGMSAFSHFVSGFYTQDLIKYLSFCTPAAMLGTLCSFPLIKYISQNLFKKILLFIVAFAGITGAINIIIEILSS